MSVISKPKLKPLDTSDPSDYGSPSVIYNGTKSLLRKSMENPLKLSESPFASTFDKTEQKDFTKPQEQAAKIFNSMEMNSTLNKHRLSQSLCFDSIPSIQQSPNAATLTRPVGVPTFNYNSTSKVQFANFKQPLGSTNNLSTNRSLHPLPKTNSGLSTSPFRSKPPSILIPSSRSRLSVVHQQFGFKESPEKQ